MNLGKLLGIASPGLAATGLFGGDAQGMGTSALGAMSPLLMALFHHKHGTAPTPDPNAAPAAPGAVPGATPGAPMVPAAPAAPAAPVQSTGLSNRQRMGLSLMQLGQNYSNPFAPRY